MAVAAGQTIQLRFDHDLGAGPLPSASIDSY